MKKKILIEGMSCGHCVSHVEDALEKINGVSNIKVSLEEKYAIVYTDVNNEVLKEAIEEEGYDVIEIEG